MPESALGRRADRLVAGSVPGAVTLAEIPFLAKIGLRGDPADARFRDAARSALELDLALQPNTFTRRDALRCLWLGPDEWLVVGPAGAVVELSGRLEAALQGRHAAIVDLSAAHAAFELRGERAREVLAKACSLDLHPRAFRPGQCAQSNFARTQAVLALEDDAPAFRLFVRRSFALYLADWLLDAMREYRAVNRLS
ncbi:MAG TPA: sarcosine oxidase subunit gamma family protein [Burkholderiales bacterium]|nr:sarcosine oxidase subunit gamma family protein [Burkholderiales bacterium]